MSSKAGFETNDPKINGFSRPFNKLQILSWFVYGYLNISFHLVYGIHEDHIFILFNFIHIILSFIMFTSAYVATARNVVDKLVKERGFPKQTMSLVEFREKYNDRLKKQEFCWCKYCNWYVTKTSKHCRACNRCTSNFDHHCRWLNSCISDKNYVSFIATVCSTEILLLYEIILGILLLTHDINPTKHIFINSTHITLIHTLITLHIVIASCLALPLLQLIGFHIYLYRKQISTYDWIVNRELKKLEKLEKKALKKIKNKTMKKTHRNIENKCNQNSNENIISVISDNIKVKNNQSMHKYIQHDKSINIEQKIDNENIVKNRTQKYVFSLRDCYSRKNISESNRKTELISTRQQNMGKDINFDGKLSVLSNLEEVANDMKFSKQKDACFVSICMKKQNSIHVGNNRVEKYSDNNNEIEGDRIFGPDCIQSENKNQNDVENVSIINNNKS
eukprot:400937_1